MTGNQLVDDYLGHLSSRLPTAIVEELEDGVTETYVNQLSRTTDDIAAAKATIAAFGHPDAVVRAFVRNSPGRRLAKALLATGPFVGLMWGASLIMSNAWNWPIPFAARIAFGSAVFFGVGALLATTRTTDRVERCRIAAATGALTIIVLDATMITTALTFATPQAWLLPLAIAASSIRLTLTIPRIPHVLRV